MAPWADVLYACDYGWWKWHEDKPELQAFPGRKVIQISCDEDIRTANRLGLSVIKSVNRDGLSQEPGVIYQGSNSGYQAINLAYYYGARKVVLIGYDLQRTNGQDHWFGPHPNRVQSGYAGWLPRYATLAESARKIGLEIVNCTAETALTCFRRARLEDVL